MKILFLMVATISFGLFSCSSDDGPSCEDVCAKVAECNPDSAADCNQQCPHMKEIMRGSVYTSMGNCFLDTTCDVLNSDDAYCLQQAMAEIPDGVVDDFLGKICEKTLSCATSEMTKEECVSNMKENGGDSMQAVGLFNDSVLNCVTDCYSATDCASLENAMEGCMSQCGMDFGTSE